MRYVSGLLGEGLCRRVFLEQGSPCSTVTPWA